MHWWEFCTPHGRVEPFEVPEIRQMSTLFTSSQGIVSDKHEFLCHLFPQKSIRGSFESFFYLEIEVLILNSWPFLIVHLNREASNGDH